MVTSLTTNILSPIIGLFAGRNFDAFELNIFGVSIMYGAFITSVIDFIIMAFVVFLIVKLMNKIMDVGKKQLETEETPIEEPAARECPFCMTSINIKATRCPACTSELDLNPPSQ